MNNKYVFVVNKVSNSCAIKITEGIYTGLIINFGKVKFNENKDDDKLNVLFEYNVHQYPDDCQDGWEDGELVDYLGEILMNIINNDIEKGCISEFLTGDNND